MTIDSRSTRGCICGAADLLSCVCPPVASVRASAFFNPFNGKCIHGYDGAKIIDDSMKSRKCPVCYPELAHTCPYGEEIMHSDALCTCSIEQVRECQNEI